MGQKFPGKWPQKCQKITRVLNSHPEVLRDNAGGGEWLSNEKTENRVGGRAGATGLLRGISRRHRTEILKSAKTFGLPSHTCPRVHETT